MDIKLVEKDGGAELRLVGRLDTNTAPEAEKLILSLCEKYDSLTINMDQLEYMSSAGIRSVKRFYVAMKNKGGKLCFTNVGASIYEVLEMTGYSAFLNLEKKQG